MRMRWHLTVLVLGLVVPLLLFVAAMAAFLAGRERNAVEQGMQHTVRAMASAFDAVALDTLVTLQVLAASKDLDVSDLDDFGRDIADVPAVYGGAWALVTLVDAEGRELLRLYGPGGDVIELPPADQSDYLGTVLATARPTISTIGTLRTADDDLLLPFSVPVLRQGQVEFVLTAFYRASALSRLFDDQHLAAGWIGAVTDRANRIIARSSEADSIVGQQATPEFAATIGRADSGRFVGVRHDGVRAVTRFLRSAQTGWTIALSAPEDAFLAASRRAAWSVAVAGAFFLAAGLAVPTLLGRRIARSIRSLSGPARALGRGEPLATLPRSSIAEVQELAGEMENAAALLQQRRHERDEAEARLAARVRQHGEVAALGVEALQQRDLDNFLAGATARVAAVLEIDICSILQLAPDGDGFRMRAAAGLQPGVIGTHLPAGRASHAGYTLEAGQPVIVEDYAAETRFAVPAFVREHGIVSAATVIIHGPDRPFGVVGASSCTRRTFTPEDVTFLQAVANVVSIAIARQAGIEALQRSEQRHRSVVQLAQQIIWIHVDGAIVFANPYAARVCGFASPDEMIGRDVLSLFHPDDRERARERARRIIEEGISAPRAEMRLLGAGGSVVLAEMQAMPIPHDGRMAVLGIGDDITERRRAEDALRENENRFRMFVETASDFLWEMDAQLRFTYVSRNVDAAQPVLGLSIDEMPPHADDPEAMRRHVEDLRAHRPFRDFVFSWVDRSGARRHVRLSGAPVFDAAGAFQGFRGTGTEITAQKEAEERLLQMDKMEAIGQLTGGVAHDFNNLLSVVIGNAEMLLDHIDPQQKLAVQLATQIGLAGQRGAELTKRLLAFSRRQPLTPQRLDLNRLVRNMEPLLRRTLGEDIEIRTMLAGDLGTTLADISQTENALLNLAVNARDAMPRGGQLTIETRNVQLDEGSAGRPIDLRPGSYVQLAVSDTGTGMPAEVRRRAFEPFFTTKEKGKGTGLGLATLYGFARQSGGHATIYSEEGHGTTVKLYLPRDTAGEQEAADSPEVEIARGQGEVVLLVEDDADVRATVRLRLDELGYGVVEAPDGVAAAALVRAGAPVDMVLTDMVMPGGMDGWDLALSLWQERPDLPVLFMTGYTDNAILRKASADRRARVLSKPFRKRDLAIALRQTLERKPE